MPPDDEPTIGSKAETGAGRWWVSPIRGLGPDAIALMERQHRCLELRGLIAASPLLRVVPAGIAVARNDVTVELLALEVREAGIRAWLRFAPTDPDPPDGVRPGYPFLGVDDGEGATYEAIATVNARIGFGGEVEAFVVPRPRTREFTLTVTLPRITESPQARSARLPS